MEALGATRLFWRWSSVGLSGYLVFGFQIQGPLTGKHLLSRYGGFTILVGHLPPDASAHVVLNDTSLDFYQEPRDNLIALGEYFDMKLPASCGRGRGPQLTWIQTGAPFSEKTVQRCGRQSR